MAKAALAPTEMLVGVLVNTVRGVRAKSGGVGGCEGGGEGGGGGGDGEGGGGEGGGGGGGFGGNGESAGYTTRTTLETNEK